MYGAQNSTAHALIDIASLQHSCRHDINGRELRLLRTENAAQSQQVPQAWPHLKIGPVPVAEPKGLKNCSLETDPKFRSSA